MLTDLRSQHCLRRINRQIFLFRGMYNNFDNIELCIILVIVFNVPEIPPKNKCISPLKFSIKFECFYVIATSFAESK